VARPGSAGHQCEDRVDRIDRCSAELAQASAEALQRHRLEKWPSAGERLVEVVGGEKRNGSQVTHGTAAARWKPHVCRRLRSTLDLDAADGPPEAGVSRSIYYGCVAVLGVHPAINIWFATAQEAARLLARTRATSPTSL